MRTNRQAAVAERRHRSVSVAPPGWNTLPDLRDSRENIFTNDFGVGVRLTPNAAFSPSSMPDAIFDSRGRYLAPPQSVLPVRPAGIWDQNRRAA